MTKKRFNFIGGYLYDGNKPIGHVEDVKFRQDYEDIVNTLHEENEQLKSRVDYLERKIQRERVSYQKQHEKWENEIQKENEKLKAQLYCDDEEGVCNICKHHYLVKNDEAELGYYNSRCNKGHYECARVSLKYCEDFEKELEDD